jgi:O-methyltransferase domain
MNARSLLSVLFHAQKALDLVHTAREIGLIAKLDAGPVTLGELVDATGARPLRLYKFLDGLESLGLVVRDQRTDGLLDARYVSREPLSDAVEAVLGEGSIESDRDKYPWREIHGRLGDVLSGRLDARFAWPPREDADVRAFEASMAAGCTPIVEALRGAGEALWAAESTAPPAESSCGTAAAGVTRLDAGGRRCDPGAGPSGSGRLQRWLDVGGGDGAVAEALLREHPSLTCDVFNLPSVAPLVVARTRNAGLHGRLGFVGGDFLSEPLPGGYDVLSFVRVLHDWPADVARVLLHKARAALPSGARIIVCEEFRNQDRLAVQLFWTYFLIGVDACVSRLRELEWYTEALTMVGFTDIRVIHGAFDVVTAVAA